MKCGTINHHIRLFDGEHIDIKRYVQIHYIFIESELRNGFRFEILVCLATPDEINQKKQFFSHLLLWEGGGSRCAKKAHLCSSY